MLPAPIVLPKIHLPDWVGMMVRALLCLEVEALGAEGASAWPCCEVVLAAAEAEPLWAAVAEGAMSGW